MKRFWTEVTLDEQAGRFRVMLDGRPMRLPGGPLLVIESPALAEAIAAEWRDATAAPDGTLRLEDIPLNRIAGTVQERIAPDPSPAAAALCEYAISDLLCYRSETPAALAELEQERWQPWLDWAALELNAPLRVTSGVMPIDQPASSVQALQDAVWQLAPAELGGLGIVVPVTGSLVLGLALSRGAIDAAAVASLTLLHDRFQAEQWGEDREARIRWTNLTRDIDDAARFMDLARG